MQRKRGNGMKKLKPNYEMLFNSAVSALQDTYANYKKAIIKNIQCGWIGSDGRYTFYEGIEERNERIKELGKEVIRLQIRIEEIKRLMESEG